MASVISRALRLFTVYTLFATMNSGEWTWLNEHRLNEYEASNVRRLTLSSQLFIENVITPNTDMYFLALAFMIYSYKPINI
jgi:hypothetical protein